MMMEQRVATSVCRLLVTHAAFSVLKRKFRKVSCSDETIAEKFSYGPKSSHNLTRNNYNGICFAFRAAVEQRAGEASERDSVPGHGHYAWAKRERAMGMRCVAAASV